MAGKTIVPCRRRPLTVLLCGLFLTLTVLFFCPMEVFLTNAKEITVPFRNVWWLQLIFALLCGLLLSGVALLLPGRLSLIGAGAFLGGGAAFYAQIMLMNGGMPTAEGDGMNVTQTQQVLNLAAWILIVLGVVLAVALLSRRRLKPLVTAMNYAACVLIAVQAVGFVTTAVTTDTTGLLLEHNLSKEGEFELSGGTNVVEFVIDSADSSFFGEMLERYPEMNEVLSGWTWYPDAASEYTRTYPGVPYLLTGGACRFDRLFQTYVEEAFEGSAYLRGLRETGADIRIFTSDPQFVAPSADEYVANSSPLLYDDIRNLRLPVLEENLVKMALYKGAPYLFKGRFRYEIAEINNDSFFPGYSSRDVDFHRDLLDTPMTVSDAYGKAFRYYYLQGIHPGVDWDQDLVVSDPGWDEQLASKPVEEITGPDLADSLRGSFRNVELFIARMKELGIYDKATIIITADHGRGLLSGKPLPLKVSVPLSPLILIKYPDSDTARPLETNMAPVCHADLFAVAEKGIGAPVSGTGSGKTPAEIPQGESRDRFCYLTVYRTNNKGEVALLEYRISGDARELSSWKATGNWWDIVYSSNIVSRETFPGF